MKQKLCLVGFTRIANKSCSMIVLLHSNISKPAVLHPQGGAVPKTALWVRVVWFPREKITQGGNCV